MPNPYPGIQPNYGSVQLMRKLIMVVSLVLQQQSMENNPKSDIYPMHMFQET